MNEQSGLVIQNAPKDANSERRRQPNGAHSRTAQTAEQRQMHTAPNAELRMLNGANSLKR
jgi:hypothetical protein